MANIDAVREIYGAFGRGDIPAILGHLAENVDWEYGPVSTDVPWLQHRRGRAQVGEFFAALQALDFHTFTPTQFLADGAVVVALVDLEATVRATGKRFVEVDETHIWRFDDAGRVVRFRHRVDSYQQWAAFKGVGS